MNLVNIVETKNQKILVIVNHIYRINRIKITDYDKLSVF